MEIAKDLWEAAEDLRYLLNRGYPRDASLQLVGNHYNLDHDYRHLLRRGVFPASLVEERERKRVPVGELRGEGLAVDGYNCIITLESALKGKTIVLADDGFVRDISGVSGGYRETPETTKALGLIMAFLQSAGPAEALFLLDSPIRGSGELAARIRTLMKEHGIQGDASAIKVPERIMAGYRGIIASSDTAVIDQSERVFDLAGHLIAEHLRIPSIIEIKKQ
ncbi:MAG: hypothetical protein A2Y65_04125 [Deltaproteobacteria bacterium RBG_13_52_11]|nr:MAG: hypothetical protein A2Y65_04125 [Deltaproteobacteria bacterium RBG_13_52_11]